MIQYRQENYTFFIFLIQFLFAGDDVFGVVDRQWCNDEVKVTQVQVSRIAEERPEHINQKFEIIGTFRQVLR